MNIIDQACQTRGPRAAFGPRLIFCGPQLPISIDKIKNEQ
jgi:hypothetical protein